MNKLYLILWASKYDPDWHCHFVNADKELAELQFKLDCKKNPTLVHHLIEIDDPGHPEKENLAVEAAEKEPEPTLN